MLQGTLICQQSNRNDSSFQSSFQIAVPFLYRARSLVVSDLRSENQRFPIRVQLLTIHRGDFSEVIARLMPMCL